MVKTALHSIILQPGAGTLQARIAYGLNIEKPWEVEDSTMGDYLTDIKDAYFHKEVKEVRDTKTDAERKSKKLGVPFGRLSRDVAGIHSGFIVIDLDHLGNLQAVKTKLTQDKYVFAAFLSVSGTGLAVLVKIDGRRHLDAFKGLASYFYETYGLVIDRKCSDITRARFASHDPQLYLNPDSQIFKKYLPKEVRAAQKQKSTAAIAAMADIEAAIEELERQNIDLVPEYSSYMAVGFASVNQFGEDGRELFRRVCIIGEYDQTNFDKHYDNFLSSEDKKEWHDSRVTINYFLNLCKDAGVTIESEETTLIKHSAYNAKRAGVIKESVIVTLTEKGLPADLVNDVTEQVYSKDVELPEASIIDALELFIKNKYPGLRINSLTNQLEFNGKEFSNRDIISLEVEIKKNFQEADWSSIGKVINSNSIPACHPIKTFIDDNKDLQPVGVIDALADTIISPQGPGYVRKFLKKWMVSMVALIYEDDPSPLMLVLCGEKQGTGKTFFFTNFLPKVLRRYGTVKNFSSLRDATQRRDFEVAISKFWLVFDDELAGKSKKDNEAIKAILSTSRTSVRASHDRFEESRKRIAAFGATTNETGILSDHTGNRRIIPIEVTSIDHKSKDAIDPTDYIIEAYHLYKSGFNYRILGNDIAELNAATQSFEAVSVEREMTAKYYRAPSNNENGAVYRTATDVRNRLQSLTKEKLNPNKLNAALREIGITAERRKVNKIFSTWYRLIEMPDLDEYDI